MSHRQSSQNNQGRSSHNSNGGGSGRTGAVLARGASSSNGRSGAPAGHQQSRSSQNGNGSGRTGVVYTDGACSGNGRSGASAGWGYCWHDGGKVTNESSGSVGGHQTSNRAELTAIRNALGSSHSRQYDRVVVHTDSDLACKTMNQYVHNWDQNGWKTSKGTPVANQDVIRDISHLKGGFKEVVFKHVPGHSGNAGNDRADHLARQGAKK